MIRYTDESPPEERVARGLLSSSLDQQLGVTTIWISILKYLDLEFGDSFGVIPNVFGRNLDQIPYRR